jgi:hypothetical protein
MKKLILALGFAALSAPSLSQAEQAPAWISHVYCAGPGVTVTFTGFQTFNVTRFNLFGIPFSEQAVVTSADSDGSTKLEFVLRGILTRTEYRLTLTSHGMAGTLSSPNSTIPLACNSGGTLAN